MNINILVIDDDKLIRWSLEEIITQEGYHVDSAETTQAAIEKANQTTYDLIFSDIEIDNENGIEMLKDIRTSQPEATVVILSAVQKSKIEPQVEGLNIFSILEKPFKSEEIKTLTSEILNLSNHSDGRCVSDTKINDEKKASLFFKSKKEV